MPYLTDTPEGAVLALRIVPRASKTPSPARTAMR